MKFLTTIGYLLIMSGKTPIAMKQAARAQDIAMGRSSSVVMAYALGLIVQLFGFVQFWLLTRIFPVNLYLALVAAGLVALAIQSVIGAAAGLTIAQTKQKVGVLTTIWSIHNKAGGCFVALVSVVVLLASVVGSMATFWTHPLGQPAAVGWIAFYEFILPLLIPIIALNVFFWPTITSEFIDDDCRTNILLSQFSQALAIAISLVYPVWLFQYEFERSIGPIPAHWMWDLISVPFVAFLLGGLCPYVIGFWKYRAQTRAMSSWHHDWLGSLLTTLAMPAGSARSKAIAMAARSLKTQREWLVGKSELLKFFLEITSPSAAPGPPTRPDAAALPAAAELVVVPATSTAASAGSAPEANTFTTLQQYAAAVPFGGVQDPMRQAREFIKENRNNLITWDVSFQEIAKLHEFNNVISTGGEDDIAPYVKAQIAADDAKPTQAGGKKPIVLGALQAVLSGALAYLTKTDAFQRQVAQLVLDLFKK